MIYTLMIWTTVAAFGQGTGAYGTKQFKDWRSLGEFHQDDWERKYDAKQMCENAARQLGLSAENYRCIRSK